MQRTSLSRLWFSIFMLVLMAVFFTLALTYDSRAALMPLIVSTPGLLLSIFNLIKSLRTVIRDKQSIPAPHDNSLNRRFIKEFEGVIWLIGLFVGIYLLGFLVTMPIYMFLYLRIRSKEGWPVSIGIPIGVLLLMYLFFMNALKVQLYSGYIYNNFLS